MPATIHRCFFGKGIITITTITTITTPVWEWPLHTTGIFKPLRF
jgi:hypothetical protein